MLHFFNPVTAFLHFLTYWETKIMEVVQSCLDLWEAQFRAAHSDIAHVAPEIVQSPSFQGSRASLTTKMILGTFSATLSIFEMYKWKKSGQELPESPKTRFSLSCTQCSL